MQVLQVDAFVIFVKKTCHVQPINFARFFKFFLPEFITLSVHTGKQYKNYSHNHKLIWVELEEKI